jgi:L-Ala-D/L-Glu epimerase
MIPTTIAAIHASALDIALIEPFAIAKGAPAIASNVLVRIELADGTVGLGEAAPFSAVTGETQRGSLRAIESARPSLLAEDVRGYRRLSDRLSEALHGEPSARCAIEVAICDALTRHFGIPLWAFFGGDGRAVETDMTVTAGNSEQAARAAVAIVARNIHTIKVKVGASSAEADAERLQAVHRAAPAATLIADANGGYTPREAARFLAALKEMKVRLELFEQPVDPQDWLEFRRTMIPSDVLLCADESARSAAEVLRLIREDAIDAVNIKPMKTGVVESIAIWNLARAAGIKLMIGGMLESTLSMSFSVHLAAGLGGFSYADLDTPMFMKEEPFAGGFEQQGARLSVAHDQAGHGVSVRQFL